MQSLGDVNWNSNVFYYFEILLPSHLAQLSCTVDSVLVSQNRAFYTLKCWPPPLQNIVRPFIWLVKWPLRDNLWYPSCMHTTSWFRYYNILVCYPKFELVCYINIIISQHRMMVRIYSVPLWNCSADIWCIQICYHNITSYTSQWNMWLYHDAKIYDVIMMINPGTSIISS